MPFDFELPVWTIRPNWRDGILERLDWLTDVLGNGYGAEQRRALRASPRRTFEMSFNPVDAVRSYFDLWLHRMGALEFMAPLFHDKGKLAAAAPQGSTALALDTVDREFAAGQLALLVGDDPFTFDKVTIQAVTPGAVTLATGTTHPWPKGAALYPLRRARISQESLLAALTNRVGAATLQFELNQANDLADEGEWATTYLGHPVLLNAPNRRENIDLTFLRNSMVLDNDHGLRALQDDAGRAFTLQTHSRLIRGRADMAEFRRFLYRLCGQRSSIWIPTFNRDFELSRAKAAGVATLDVKKFGYGYTGGAVSGRRHVLLPNGDVREITGTSGAPSAAEERLVLSAPLGSPLAVGAHGSFMDTCRLAGDSVEIKHYSDSGGAAECALGFRSFRDERVAAEPIAPPVVVGVVSQSSCGVPAPEEAACTVIRDYMWQMEISWAVAGNIPKFFPFVLISRGGDPEVPFAQDAWFHPGEPTAESIDFGTSTMKTTYTFAMGASDYTERPRNYKIQHQFPYGAFPCGGSQCGSKAQVRYRHAGTNYEWRVATILNEPDSPVAFFRTTRLFPVLSYFRM